MRSEFVEVADAVLDQVGADRLGRMPVERARAARRVVRVRRVDDGADQPARADEDAVDVRRGGRVVVDRRVDVIRRLDRDVVVQRHPGHRPGGLAGDHRAVAGRGVALEPALVAERRVHADAGLADVVDDDLEVRPDRDRLGGRDDELGLAALDALLVGVVAGRRAGRRVRVGRRDRVGVRRGVGERVGIVRAVRVAGEGRLPVHERGRDAVDRDRLDRHVRAGHGRRGRDAAATVEVQAELAQALRRLLVELDARARQELVGDGVVVDEDVAVKALVAAVAELGPDAVAGLDERARAGGADGRLRGAGFALPAASNCFCASLPRTGSPPLIFRSAALVAQPSLPLSATALRRARGDVVGALLQARHLDADEEALRGVRGDVDLRAPDQRTARAAAHHAQADVGGGGAVTVVGDDAGQVAGLGSRRQRTDRRHPDPRGVRGWCQHRQSDDGRARGAFEPSHPRPPQISRLGHERPMGLSWSQSRRR